MRSRLDPVPNDCSGHPIFDDHCGDCRRPAKKPAAVVLNAVEPQLRETEQAQAFIAKAGIALAPVYLSKAVAYHRAITAGLGVTEFEPAGKAAQEVLT
jgi:chromosome partitioning protein